MNAADAMYVYFTIIYGKSLTQKFFFFIALECVELENYLMRDSYHLDTVNDHFTSHQTILEAYSNVKSILHF